MNARIAQLWRSMPVRLALALLALFTAVSLVSLGVSYAVTQNSFEQTIRNDLRQDMIGFRAAPSARAVSLLVEAESSQTDPGRLVLSYIAPNGRIFGNAAVARDGRGYHIVSFADGNRRLSGNYLALTDTLYNGQLTIARSRSEIEALRGVFLNILLLSLLPTTLIALGGGLWLARRSKRHVDVIGGTLDDLTTGDLGARVALGKGWSDDLSRIGAKVNQMAVAQQSSVTALRQVSSDIAHDLKTPIQRVQVHLDDLSREISADPDAPARLHAQAAQDELDGIAAVFQSLLQLAQVENGNLRAHFEPVDLAALCATMCEVYEPSAGARGQTLTCVAGPGQWDVHGDRNLLGQVLANLIENAVRHTPDGTAVAVGVDRHGGRVRMWVADTGPGIPPAERASVFQRLYRLDRSRSTPGNGLGLSLVEAVVKLHGARIALEDNDPGLRVVISFQDPLRR